MRFAEGFPLKKIKRHFIDKGIFHDGFMLNVKNPIYS